MSPSDFPTSIRSEFVTFEKSNPLFREYLLGSFSREHVALPVANLHVNSANEKVTFQVFAKDDLVRPSVGQIAAQILRLDLLGLTFAPVLVCLVFAGDSFLHADLTGWALLSLFFLHGAVFGRNDYIDHLRGVDRWNERGGSRVIQRGWLKAITVQKIYRLLFVLTLLFAAPVFTVYPELLVVAVVAGVIGIWGYSHLRTGRGPWWIAVTGVFFCLGPLLTGAFSWLLSEVVSPIALLVGCYFGVLAVLYMLIRHMISMVADDEARVRTLPVRLGFDRMKNSLFLLSVVSMIQLAWTASFLQPTALSLLTFPLIVWMTFFCRRIFALSSPLSSGLFELPKELVKIQLASGLFLIGFSFV